jgi:hypothetical protein
MKEVRRGALLFVAGSLTVVLISCVSSCRRASVDPFSREWTKLAYKPLQGAQILEAAAGSKCVWRVDEDPASKGIRINATAQPANKYMEEVRLQTEAGTLVGTNHGEWGGGLSLIDAKVSAAQHILDKNVLQLLPVRSGVLVLTGLRHLDLDEGALWLYEKNSTGSWSIRKLADLDAEPSFASSVGRDIFVVDHRGVSRLDQALNIRRIASLPLDDLRPVSVAEDAQGRIYLGMNAFVVRLVPSDSGYVQEWFTKPGCLP